MITIKVVGSGCPNCQKVEQICRTVIEENEMDVEIQKITDINQFANLGVFRTPGLIIDDQLMSSGKIPTKETVRNWIKKAADKSEG